MPATSARGAISRTLDDYALDEKEEIATAESYHAVGVHRETVIVRIAGVIKDGPEVDRIVSWLEARLRSAKRTKIFFDLDGFERYDARVRIRYTEAVRGAPSLRGVYVHATSKLVRMGATVAGLAIPSLRLYERDAFYAELDAALERPR